MYKKRFKLWGFVKNNKESDVVSMLALKKRRQNMGKRTQFLINNRPINFKRVDTYLRRRKINPATLLAAAVASTSGLQGGSYISCRTPSPPPSFLQFGDGNWPSEELIAVTRSFVRANLEPDHLGVERWKKIRDTGTTYDLFSVSATCRGLLGSKNFQEAGRLLRKLARDLEVKIRAQATDVLPNLLLIGMYLGSDWPEVTAELVRHSARLSTVYIHSAQHPLRRALLQLNQLDASVFIPTAGSAFRCYYDESCQIFGEDSFVALECADMWAYTGEFDRGYTSLLQTAEASLRQCEARFGEGHEATLRYLHKLAHLHLHQAFYLGTSLDATIEQFELLSERAEAEADGYHQHVALYKLAWIYQNEGREDLAVQYMRDAIKALLEDDISEYFEDIIDACVTLEDWLERKNQHESALELRPLWEHLLPPDEEEATQSGREYPQAAC